MKNIVSAVFDNQAQAERALAQLRAQGIPDRAISIVARHSKDLTTGHSDVKNLDDHDDKASGMAKGALAHASVDLTVSITCIAGPTGAVPGKPIGLVYFCAASRSGRVIAHDRKYGDIGRTKVRDQSVLQALNMLRELAEKEEPRPPAGKS